jgi:hypothetical protein
VAMFTAAQKHNLLKATLSRGSICYWRQDFGPHFAVILNLDWPPQDDVVYFSIMTSRTEKYSAFLDDQIVRTGPTDYDFLNRDTIIDFRTVYPVALAAICSQPEFGVKGRLSDAHIALADEILMRSDTVEELVLDRVVR